MLAITTVSYKMIIKHGENMMIQEYHFLGLLLSKVIVMGVILRLINGDLGQVPMRMCWCMRRL